MTISKTGTITFKNTTFDTLEILISNTDGSERLVAKLEPGQTTVQPTTVGTSWIARTMTPVAAGAAAPSQTDGDNRVMGTPLKTS
jgi:hypothetical protein